MKPKHLIQFGTVFFVALLIFVLYFRNSVYEMRQGDLQFKPVPKLHEAVIEADKNKVEQLIKDGADIDELAAIFGRGGRETPLCVAAHAGNKDIIETLIAYGADVNKECPLRYAVRGNWKDIAVILMDNGADVNGSRRGNIPLPLIAVAERGNIEMLKLLIDRGIDIPPDPDAPNSWDSPIHIAARRGHKEMVELLLSHGVKVDTPKMDQKPLHSAAAWGRIEVAELLVTHGAQVNSKGENGVTALRNAAIGGYPEMVNGSSITAPR